MNVIRKNLILVASLLCLVVVIPCQAQEPTEEDWQWVNTHFYNVLDELLPVDERLSCSLGYRSYRDLYTDELEYSFLFKHTCYGKKVSLVIRVADMVSLYDQIMKLHIKDRDANIQSIKPKLKIKEWRFDERSCPAIKKQVDEFYRMSLQTLSARDRADQSKGVVSIILHPVVHTFKADVSGGKLDLKVTEPEHPFVLWALRTRRVLERCTSRTTRHK